MKALAIVGRGDRWKGDREYVWINPVMVNELNRPISAQG